MSMLDSHRALFEARRHSELSDAEFWAADPESQKRARDDFRAAMGRAAVDFDGLSTTRQPRPVSRDWTKVFNPIRLNYPPGHADGMGWLAELSVQKFAPPRHETEPRLVRRISIFEPDEPATQVDLDSPGTLPNLRGRYPEVTSIDRPVTLDMTQNEPIAANIRQLAEFHALLIDVRNASFVVESAK